MTGGGKLGTFLKPKVAAHETKLLGSFDRRVVGSQSPLRRWMASSQQSEIACQVWRHA
jgi:hypothetical protein